MKGSSDSTAPVAPLRDDETRTILACTAAEATYGEPLEVIVTVDGLPPVRGSATLRVAGRAEPVAAIPVQNGRAAIKLATLPEGDLRLSASFTGNRPPSVSELVAVLVRRAPTRFYGTLQPFHLVAGTAGEFTAFVEACAPSTAAPSGVVSFWQDGQKLGEGELSPVLDGGAAASAHLTPAGAGAICVTARYEGAPGFVAAPDRPIPIQVARDAPSSEPIIPDGMAGGA